jgi:hypothetical protein
VKKTGDKAEERAFSLIVPSIVAGDCADKAKDLSSGVSWRFCAHRPTQCSSHKDKLHGRR